MVKQTAAWTPGRASAAPDVDWHSVTAAAAMLGVSQRTIRRAIARGDLSAVKHAGAYRIAPADFVRYQAWSSEAAAPPVGSDLSPLNASSRRIGTSAFDLPRPLTLLIGREHEIAAGCGLLRDDGIHLLTLIGPGGVGKTRLALQVAETVAAEFADGVVFVPLAAIRDPNLVASAIGHGLNVRETGDCPLIDRLKRHLRDRRLLLLLDNFEQVLPAAALVGDLLAAAPGLRALVTSRAVLRLSGEQILAVPPLELPAPGQPPPLDELARYAAILLFTERAQARRADFRLTPENAPAVAAVCARLDGLPLAIELAAARIGLLPPQTLLVRLARRLPLLIGGPQDQPERLRTMRDAIAWSYDLLAPDEQMIFRRLAVFSGGCSLEAAEEMVAPSDRPDRPRVDVLEGLGALIDNCLVSQDVQPNGEPRFGMLETIREFGLEQLAASGEEQTIRRAHAAWCVELAERGWDDLVSLTFYDSIARIAVDVDNLRAALDWLDQNNDVTGVLRLAGSLGEFWLFYGHRQEGRRWLERALDLEHSTTVPATVRARALRAAGWLAVNRGEHARALALGSECLALWCDLGDRQSTALAHHLLGYTALAQGDYDTAVAHCEASEAIFDALGNAWWVAGVRSDVLGRAVHGQGDSAEATAVLEASLGMYHELGDTLNAALTLNYLGFIACDRADHSAAAARFAEGLPLWRQLGTREMQADWLAGVATLAAIRGSPERAARLFGAAEGLRDALGHAFVLPERLTFERAIVRTRAALGDSGYVAAWAAGRVQSLSQALDEASEFLAIVAAAPPSEPRGAAYNAELTRREQDVLRLLVAGHSDKEIAEALFIGARTVQTHAEKIYIKLGVRNRHEATAVAVRRGLA